ncbi:fumarylacetoacetate hydrolase family protein [Nitriliruptor alkaliphilus]|uniref:fumarylacetoacetate hydrolase family protein n=1 Tax=Nitriliruptor alkaliphilus TaxID=427918 RepID=UPI000696BA3E|nr:fumarylacetoacetate hydrolase family protein [Nitriliruptor alkaliphilus]
MKLATIRTSHGTRAVRVEEEGYVDLGAADVGELLALDDWSDRASADGDRVQGDLAPVVPRPGKIICVGLNYAPHIREMGRELPEHPTLFAKFTEALIGPHDPVQLPAVSEALDWEAELALVIGRPVRHADEEAASAAIAGFTVCNDVTIRDWQYRTKQWLQGKTFEATTPLGPFLVTPDELPGGTRPELAIRTIVGGEKMQEADTSELVFDPVALVTYASTILTLQPGDVIITGTPGGVGHARKPPRYLRDGDVLVTEIDGLGRCENPVVRA